MEIRLAYIEKDKNLNNKIPQPQLHISVKNAPKLLQLSYAKRIHRI